MKKQFAALLALSTLVALPVQAENLDTIESFQEQKTQPAYKPVADPLSYPGVPKAGEVVNGNQKTVTSLATTRDDANHGTWVKVTTTLYAGLRNVVSIYREWQALWLGQLEAQQVTYTSYGGIASVLNYDKVVNTVAKAGWSKVENAVRKGGSDAGASNYAILLDADTGEIVGNVPIGVGYGSRGWETLHENAGKIGRTYGNETQTARDDAAQYKNGGLVTVPLADGSSLTVNMVGFAYQGSPILLDLGGLGRPDLLAGSTWRSHRDRQVIASALRPFDLDGTGEVAWEWVGPKSGLLVWDPEHDGQISSGQQLFGNYTWGKRWKDGYEPLSTLDRNQDGKLAGKELDSLGVWVDANSNGACDPHDVKPLSTYGIESISVQAERDAGGNAMAKAGFVRKLPDGKRQTLATWDWISMGLAKASDGVYCWVGKSEGKDIGGVLRLTSQSGKVKGLSCPTIGNMPPAKKVLVGLPLQGNVGAGKVRWSYPVPGGIAESEAILARNGKQLVGHTKIKGSNRSIEYDWQAELVKGTPIGPRQASGAGV